MSLFRSVEPQKGKLIFDGVMGRGRESMGLMAC